MLVLADPVLRAPNDPGPRGLWGIVALIVLLALLAAHMRVLRAVARQLDGVRVEGVGVEGVGVEGVGVEGASVDRRPSGGDPADLPR